MRPASAATRPWRQAATKASVSPTTWSAASASTTASPSRVCAKTDPAAIAGPESRRIGSSSTSASSPISTSCSSTMKRYAALVMTIGRSNNAASETRNSVSWNVERGPNKERNCFGRPSRDAGHSRVPAPPHMISGMIRLSIETSNLRRQAVVVAIPRRESANAVLDRSLRSKSDIAYQIIDIGEGLHDVARLHRNHFLHRLDSQLIFQNRHDVHELLRAVVADIVNPHRRAVRLPVAPTTLPSN